MINPLSLDSYQTLVNLWFHGIVRRPSPGRLLLGLRCLLRDESEMYIYMSSTVSTQPELVDLKRRLEIKNLLEKWGNE